MMISCIVCSLIARRRHYLLINLVVLLPILTLIWIAQQNLTYYIDCVVILLACYSWAYYADNYINKNKAEQGIL